MLRVFKEVQTLFLDPRLSNNPKMTTIASQDGIEEFISYNYFNPLKVPYFNMTMCTSLSVLRRAYWECGYNLQRGDDDHYKVVATQLDFVLTSLERVYHYQGYMDFFSKPRAF